MNESTNIVNNLELTKQEANKDKVRVYDFKLIFHNVCCFFYAFCVSLL